MKHQYTVKFDRVWISMHQLVSSDYWHIFLNVMSHILCIKWMFLRTVKTKSHTLLFLLTVSECGRFTPIKKKKEKIILKQNEWIQFANNYCLFRRCENDTRNYQQWVIVKYKKLFSNFFSIDAVGIIFHLISFFRSEKRASW